MNDACSVDTLGKCGCINGVDRENSDERKTTRLPARAGGRNYVQETTNLSVTARIETSHHLVGCGQERR
ncbi:hypothetical protein K470DRAFT_7191 [Piedraia hortae CBS 480.64]|uniref:Uncharacterized protein n=1 Tax=Piedraia hortae CBS 480.64 TaxID=1314780 RepID=A0A6A7C6H6_9PEZI|nr:hypothetical protein K470DRAFT_7191 [Piedraia hortae CBS 480.64]